MNKQNGRGFGPQRKLYEGDWQCSKCGVKISKLPFNPDPARLDKLFCRDCHMERVRRFKK